MNFDYYLFDLDNCLLHIPNPRFYFDNILVEALKKGSINKIPELQERSKIWFSGNEYINLLKKWGASDLDNFWRYFDAIDFEYRKVLVKNKEMHLYNDVKKILKEINENNSNKTAIISNTADYIVEFITKEFNLTNCFDEIFGLSSDKDQSLAKPSPRGILSILKRLNFDKNKSNAIMIGDSIVDVLAAKRANIHVCLLRRNMNKYPDGYDDWEYSPDFVIDKLDEIVELIQSK